jgi:hypothetical protein
MFLLLNFKHSKHPDGVECHHRHVLKMVHMPRGHRLFPKTVPYLTTSPVTCAYAGIVERYVLGSCEICHNGNVNSVV